MKYFIKTYGCQANEADSERIAGLYQKKGFKPAKSLEEAEVVIINTCSVRESAENRVYGLIHNLTERRGKEHGKTQKIVLAGCMLRYGVSDLKKKLPEVDEFLRMEDYNFDLSPAREEKKTALVPIMEGCSHYCSYCVVPYARGREKSRPFEEIVCEVEKLVKQGYKEITLLGQNVNSYGKDFSSLDINKVKDRYHVTLHDTRSLFAVLLYVLNNITSLKRIKFLTSNPWDLTDEIIQSIKLPEIEKYLHLPVQSGDDKILKKMNRPYTTKQYLSLIAKIRKEIPDIKIGTDIIIGFPGETKEQFENTVKLCQKVGFVKAYIAKYSPRPGTAAFKLKDDISPKEKKRRWRILDELINKNGK
ncbi:tRNA (N6-isopentenyl adenosine(37)-C2)-methylthiotransferase MiaB [Candidatus Shapirobacteria bacterium CG10_big_fil_rev_8_21_14_0_10_40_9]|uniref:tRNA-2-methylthio-N(6)-dimethylallyladenosine synthase n=1 Tax=Candidatus Shapirobacteria bacterium CG10_big_fil_rev_8_21_14_0_10_40_9 TaxID=1974888 RepID=A0A2M8L4H5_9BACT|nr:MAG: tRNA (N6-isopentenyl adenosine(37)-C2)-methylthiotransferase MiaB [Candidatus Shapirobacteria bacterium CG10_big_fil_rev_8_21_14_0_10_40_9]